MALTDPFVVRTLHSSAALTYVAQGVAIGGILIVGKLLSRRGRNAGSVT
jgi:hypothetical protein